MCVYVCVSVLCRRTMRLARAANVRIYFNLCLITSRPNPRPAACARGHHVSDRETIIPCTVASTTGLALAASGARTRPTPAAALQRDTTGVLTPRRPGSTCHLYFSWLNRLLAACATDHSVRHAATDTPVPCGLFDMTCIRGADGRWVLFPAKPQATQAPDFSDACAALSGST